MKILMLLEKNDNQHLRAEDVYRMLLEAGEEIGLATIYRVLTQFEVAGLVERHNFEGGYSVFELNRGHHHDHIVCVSCGKVEEFTDDTIEERQKAIARENGFEFGDHSLTLYGRCRDKNCSGRKG
ncbi:MAG: ferric iron uptake transcriptional regulator [Gammaproteobacteria bacterium]|nr:ferric iron uptake transcriptional regulator [Gammaproteobacteria bacterium]